MGLEFGSDSLFSLLVVMGFPSVGPCRKIKKYRLLILELKFCEWIWKLGVEDGGGCRELVVVGSSAVVWWWCWDKWGLLAVGVVRVLLSGVLGGYLFQLFKFKLKLINQIKTNQNKTHVQLTNSNGHQLVSTIQGSVWAYRAKSMFGLLTDF